MGCVSSKNATGAEELKPRVLSLFVPTVQIAWLIDGSAPLPNEDPNNPAWVQSANSILCKELGFSKVVRSTNLTAGQLHSEFKKMLKRLEIARGKKQKTLLFLYYRGNGGLD